MLSCILLALDNDLAHATFLQKPATATKIPAKMEAPVLKRTLGLNASVPHSGTV